MKIAIIGSGISGLLVAYLLAPDHDITVFEANDYVGGHSNTVDVQSEGQNHAVDTGFIVFNDKTYPNFVRLLQKLKIAVQNSKMSFGLQCEKTGLEYSTHSLNGLLAQRRSLFKPSFYRLFKDVLRFNRNAIQILKEESSISLDEYLRQERYSQEFIDQYIIPMGASIWSAQYEAMLEFPAQYLIQFFHNHGMLSYYDQPQWKTITGGSREYVKALTKSFHEKIRLSCPVNSIRRFEKNVEITTQKFGTERFDKLILATHSDQALQLLQDPSPAERQILGDIGYQENNALLHTDAAILPKSRRAWSSWNYHIFKNASFGPASLTYNMNSLQAIRASKTFCLSLNYPRAIETGKKLYQVQYHHPVFSPAAIKAQKRHAEIDGERNTHFCGAYWSYGFHEDGVKSALVVAKKLGKTLD